MGIYYAQCDGCSHTINTDHERASKCNNEEHRYCESCSENFTYNEDNLIENCPGCLYKTERLKNYGITLILSIKDMKLLQNIFNKAAVHFGDEPERDLMDKILYEIEDKE